ncbi:MAG: GFA family protein [Gammaproteobacteria bacterium]|nr:GFA family protein [Gammaproteobacteria bacterium]
MKVDGSCHCGYITYSAEVDSDAALICHCTDCQTLSGSAYRTVLPTPDKDFQLHSGKLKTYVKTAQSGRRRAQTFCPECGSPIYAAPVDDGPKTLNLRIGTIRQRAELIPKLQVWHRSALPWAQDIHDLPARETQ